MPDANHPVPAYLHHLVTCSVVFPHRLNPLEDVTYPVITQFLLIQLNPPHCFTIYPQIELMWNPTLSFDARSEIPDIGLVNFRLDKLFIFRMGIELKMMMPIIATLPMQQHWRATWTLWHSCMFPFIKWKIRQRLQSVVIIYLVSNPSTIFYSLCLTGPMQWLGLSMMLSWQLVPTNLLPALISMPLLPTWGGWLGRRCGGSCTAWDQQILQISWKRLSRPQITTWWRQCWKRLITICSYEGQPTSFKNFKLVIQLHVRIICSSYVMYQIACTTTKLFINFARHKHMDHSKKTELPLSKDGCQYQPIFCQDHRDHLPHPAWKQTASSCSCHQLSTLQPWLDNHRDSWLSPQSQ